MPFWTCWRLGGHWQRHSIISSSMKLMYSTRSSSSSCRGSRGSSTPSTVDKVLTAKGWTVSPPPALHRLAPAPSLPATAAPPSPAHHYVASIAEAEAHAARAAAAAAKAAAAPPSPAHHCLASIAAAAAAAAAAKAAAAALVAGGVMLGRTQRVE